MVWHFFFQITRLPLSLLCVPIKSYIKSFLQKRLVHKNRYLIQFPIGRKYEDHSLV